MPEKASGFLGRQRLSQRWMRNFAYPGSIPASPGAGLSIPHRARAVKVQREVGKSLHALFMAWLFSEDS